MEQPMIKEDQPKAAEPPKDEPPIGTGIKGDGPADSFGLGGGSGNGGFGGGNGGSKWGWYAGQVSSRIQSALQQNRKTRSASMNVKFGSGLTRPVAFRGPRSPDLPETRALDAAISETLTGLQLQEPPPTGMPAPIVLQIAARRPRFEEQVETAVVGWRLLQLQAGQSFTNSRRRRDWVNPGDLGRPWIRTKPGPAYQPHLSAVTAANPPLPQKLGPSPFDAGADRRLIFWRLGRSFWSRRWIG